MSKIIDPNTGNPMQQSGAQNPQAPQAPPASQIPIDPNTGNPIVNPNTEKPYTEPEWLKAQAEANAKVDMMKKMADEIFPDAFVMIGASGIVHANGEVFRLAKLCEMGAEELDTLGKERLAQVGWPHLRRDLMVKQTMMMLGQQLRGGGAPGQSLPGQPMPGQPQMPPMSKDEKEKFVKETKAAMEKQAASQKESLKIVKDDTPSKE